MKLVEVRGECELQALQSAWEGLLQDSASNTIFLTWEWVTAWWSAYGTPGDLRVLTAWNEDGRLLGIAPLRRESKRKYGQTVEAYSFVGEGSNDSEYLDCIAAPGFEDRVMEAFERHWSQDLERGSILMLQEVPAASLNLPRFQKLAEQRGILSKEMQDPCGTVRLPDSWESYLAMLRPRFRTKVRSVLRDLEGRPEVRFGFCTTEEELQRMLPILFDLHTRRWVPDGMPGVFGWDRKRDFYFKLSPLVLKRDWLRLSWMEWNGRILACQYGFSYGGTYFHLQEGYEPASEHRSIGIGLRAWSIREFLKEGVREYDFLGGIGRHKSDWGAEIKHSAQIQIAKASFKNILFCRGPEWETQARESLRKMIPERILAVRSARLKKGQLGSAPAPSPRGRFGQVVASCYFHLRLPVLTRPLRRQYQLSVSSASGWPRLSWRRRREASARILYYHRVNDERDPFFPATSTELFEQEMSFIARHHKVVPLSVMLKHLEDGCKESVLAITFDDGYQDNFQNAFPILRRYGLPATIFLTTGSIDSRQPLWFEQLAHALKKTACEYIDLEIDIPRRFRLGTEAERLESNGGIFALLRSLTDKERWECLSRILKHLSVVQDDERKDKMLTWEQVRQMKAHRIDFGGHTVNHPFLSKMAPDQALWEVSECKRRIEEELQLSADYFAYPNGREEDFGEWNKELLRTAGYEAAVTTLWGLNYRSTDRMELRRGGPWEASRTQFAYKLDWYQLVNQ